MGSNVILQLPLSGVINELILTLVLDVVTKREILELGLAVPVNWMVWFEVDSPWA